MSPYGSDRDRAGRQPTRADWHHYFHSLLWSSFLDLDFYTTRHALQRFRPYSTEQVVAELLPCNEIEQLQLGRRRGDGVREFVDERPDLAKAAIWSLAPNVFSDRMRVREDEKDPRHGGPISPQDEQTTLNRLRHVLRTKFPKLFGLEYAASPRLQARPLLPPMCEPRIGDVAVEVGAGRRCATGRLTAAVQLPCANLLEAIQPGRWGECGFWQVVEKPRGCQDADGVMVLWLPGGNTAPPHKGRVLKLAFGFAGGPFGGRVDYELRSEGCAGVPGGKPDPSPRDEAARPYDERDEDDEDEGQAVNAGTQTSVTRVYDKEARHITELRGYVSAEKLPGRPGWTQLTAERTVRFESPNHDRFRVETLLYWFAVELLSYVRTAKSLGSDVKQPPPPAPPQP